MIELVEDLGYMYQTDTSKVKRRFGMYKCSHCNNIFKARSDKYYVKRTESCGCVRKDKLVEIGKDNATHGLSEHRLYKIWTDMHTRCYNINSKSYKNYGGRGVVIQPPWKDDFTSFYKWAIDNGYTEELSLDRREVDKGYSEGNCRWVTKCVQAQNTRELMSTNTSGYRGVHFNKGGKYVAAIKANKQMHYLGIFDTAVEAAKAIQEYVIVNGLHNNVSKVLSDEEISNLKGEL